MKKGFSLIEMLVAIAILGGITAIGVSSFLKADANEALMLDADKIVSVLSEARSLTLAASGGVAWGVHFEEKKVVLFSGPSYVVGASGNIEYVLHRATKIASVSLAGGGNDVIFSKLTGATAQSGTVVLSLANNLSENIQIKILSTGISIHNNL